MANLKVFRIFMLVQKFILFIFRFLSLRKERKTHWKTTKKKENYMLAIKNSLYSWWFGWICDGIVLGKRSHEIEHTSHKIIDIALFCFATTQVFGGLIRPGKDSKHRPFFNWFHFLVGYSTIFLSLINIYKGFGILHATESWWYAYNAVLVVLGCIALGLKAYTRVKGWKSNISDKNKCTSIAIEEVRFDGHQEI